MPSFKAAYVREQGVDLVIVAVDSSFGQLSEQDQVRQIEEMQAAANQAGVVGTVVPFWKIGDRTAFIAPARWHPFFSNVTWEDLRANLNIEVSW